MNKIRNILLGLYAMVETVQYVSNIYKYYIAYTMLQQTRGASYCCAYGIRSLAETEE
jgi:hypothetical protein